MKRPEKIRQIAERAEIVGEILEKLRAGRSVDEGFRRLYELYYGPVYQFFANRGFPPEECLDLTQETFLGIYTGVGSFRREAGFDTWLFKIATNAYRKRRRWQAAEKRAGEEVLIDHAEQLSEPRMAGYPTVVHPTPDEEALSRERVQLVREAIERMPERMRKCLVLRLDQGLKYREIGVAMRLSTETVKAHLNQARRRLHKELGSYFEPAIRTLSEERT